MTFQSLDILYLVLASGVLILVIFISVFLVNLTLVLKDIRKISNTAGTITENFNNIVTKPLGLIHKLIDHIIPIIEDRLTSHKKK